MSEEREGEVEVRKDEVIEGRDLVLVVLTWTHLFGGGVEPACLDAADANDSGIVEITDPIFLLGTLFLGQREIPPPHPPCGTDDTRDDLGCVMSCGGP